MVVDRVVGDKWLVTKGLGAGDRLVVEGVSKVKAGQPVRPVPAGSKPQAGPATGSTGTGAKS